MSFFQAGKRSQITDGTWMETSPQKKQNPLRSKEAGDIMLGRKEGGTNFSAGVWFLRK